MIITEDNKEKILSGNIRMKKGFKQTPADITEKIYRDLKQINEKNKEKNIDNKAKNEYDPMKHKNAINNLNRLNKKL